MGYKWVIYGSLSESLRKMVVGGVAECVSDAISYYFPFQLVTFQPWFTNMCGLQVYTRLQPKLFVSSAKQLHFKVFGMCNLGTWTLWEQGALMNTVDGRNPAPVDMVNIPLPSRVSCSLRKKNKHDLILCPNDARRGMRSNDSYLSNLVSTSQNVVLTCLDLSFCGK